MAKKSQFSMLPPVKIGRLGSQMPLSGNKSFRATNFGYFGSLKPRTNASKSRPLRTIRMSNSKDRKVTDLDYMDDEKMMSKEKHRS